MAAHAYYDNYPEKDTLRKALVSEQRGLCCYCMGRIRSDSMKVEHWRCQSRFCGEQLDYRNLLGACQGGEGQPRSRQHCDTRKGDSDSSLESLRPESPDRGADLLRDGWCYQVRRCGIRRPARGRTQSQPPGIEDQPEANPRTDPRLVADGKATPRGPVPRERFVKERERRVGGAGDLEPFCQVSVWWLDQRLKRTARMNVPRHSESAFETVIEAHLLAH